MRLMTVAEYAKYLGASVNTVRNMCTYGKLPAVKIGKSWRIDADKADMMFQDKAEENFLPYNKERFLARINQKIRGLKNEQEKYSRDSN